MDNVSKSQLPGYICWSIHWSVFSIIKELVEITSNVKKKTQSHRKQFHQYSFYLVQKLKLLFSRLPPKKISFSRRSFPLERIIDDGKPHERDGCESSLIKDELRRVGSRSKLGGPSTCPSTENDLLSDRRRGSFLLTRHSFRDIGSRIGKRGEREKEKEEEESVARGKLAVDGECTLVTISDKE